MQRTVSPVFRSVLTALGLLGVGAYSGTASAQAAPISDCYFDAGRMVDAQPLMGAKKETDEVTGNLHYLLSLPKGYDKTKKWPVIVFMHGIGEVNAAGNMLNALTKHSLPRMVEDPMFDYPFIVISPQIDGNGWVTHATEIGAALDRIETEFGGDRNREYLTGLSYGGVGTLAVGIALADRIAALMPVTPGGSVSNWDMRSKIANKPIWFFNGLKDAEYQTNMTRSMDLEASGGAVFYKYTYAFTDEYKDIVPIAVLAQKHVFGSYENIGHDVWHAAYGVYCPTLDSQKTVQYDWLLQQSLDGSPFVDPRKPNAGTGGSGGAGGAAAGGTAGAGGASGSVGSSGSAGSLTGGAGATVIGGAGAGGGPLGIDTPPGGSPSVSAGTGGSTNAAAGTSAVTAPTTTNEENTSSGCSIAPATQKSAGASSLLLLGAVLLGSATRRRRAQPRARGGALRARRP